MYRSLIVLQLCLFSILVKAQPVCTEGPLDTNNQCQVQKDSNFYIFTSEFNGRKLPGAAPILSTLATEVSLSSGYFQDQQVQWQNETKWDATHIKKGVTLFGIEGQADDDMNYPDCTLNDSDSPPYSDHKNSSCFVDTGRYYYNNPYGGRTKECSYDSANPNKITNSPCWIDQSKASSKIVKLSESYNNCPFGLITGLCTHKKSTIQNGYYYTSEYNGRVARCCNGNAGPCTVNSKCLISAQQVPANITTSTVCNENGTLSTVNGISFFNGPISDAKNEVNCKTKTENVNGKTGRFVYSLPYGGRTNCIDNGGGQCWFYGNTKSSVFSGLEINSSTGKLKNIKLGSSVFGIQGEYVATQISYGSGAHKAKTSGTSNQIFYDAESALTNSLEIAKPQYHPIPKIEFDSDGYNKSTQVTYFSRSGFGTIIGQCSNPVYYTKADCETNSGVWTSECGNVLSTDAIQTRIDDCSVKIGTCSNSLYNNKTLCESHGGVWSFKSSWNGRSFGNAGESRWDLVTRIKVGSAYKEVWQDNSTKLLWSSLIHTSINWCKASGSNNSAALTNNYLKSPDPSNFCDNNVYQNNTSTTILPVSLCYEDSLAFQKTTSGSLEGKAGLGLSENSSDLKVQWRLPTMYDFLLANHNGIRFVLPDMNSEEWTATVSASNFAKAWIFDSSTGILQRRLRSSSMGVRCVGR